MDRFIVQGESYLNLRRTISPAGGHRLSSVGVLESSGTSKFTEAFLSERKITPSRVPYRCLHALLISGMVDRVWGRGCGVFWTSWSLKALR
ncbi:unnamed protein product [Nezara viridula]|uniref:Uncharacterized protein n=1 Tax=Nezara viridula TaxID=85310 RepID=A0A9P0MS84_NEZVI|nr:unnamed protein product [Nezara viridula]